MRTLFRCHQHWPDQHYPARAVIFTEGWKSEHIIIQWTESSNLWIALWGLLVRLMHLDLMWVYCEFVTARQELYGERAKSGSFIKKTKVEHISPHNIWKTDETNRNLPVSNTKQVASQIQHQPRKENEWSNSLMKHETTPICYD